LRERLPALEVTASRAVAGWVRTGDEDAMSLEAGRRAEFYPPDYRFAACEVEREVAEGDRLAVGSLELEVVETPGHSDGHLGFLLQGEDTVTLFSGDLVFFGGQVSLEANWDCRIPAYAASMAKLRGASVDALLPGHHFVTLRDGQRHIDAANRLFERGFVPKSVV
jgi:hydroxyacylglutathione hydrolase